MLILLHVNGIFLKVKQFRGFKLKEVRRFSERLWIGRSYAFLSLETISNLTTNLVCFGNWR